MTRATVEARSWPRLTRNRLMQLAPTCVGLFLLLLVFRSEIVAAVDVWGRSTAYNHCFLVLPIVLFLAWERRSLLAGVAIGPAPWALILAVPLSLAWLAADRLGIMEGRQLAAMGFVQLLFLATLGCRMWRAASTPLLYLFFLVPFGAFATPALQDFTTRFVVTGLNMFGVPNFTDGYTIDIPEGSFYIAEACAGLRFLIAAIAFGVLYACLLYRSVPRRLAFIAVSAIVPVFANGLRALGIILLGHVLGSAEAAATDHVLYGWIFFSVVILILIILGLPFRQDQHGPPGAVIMPLQFTPASAQPERSMILAVLLAAIALVGPAVAAGLDRLVTPPVPVALEFAIPSGCTALSEAHAQAEQRFVCDGLAVLASAELFSPRTALGPVRDRVKQVTAQPGADDSGMEQPHIAGAGPLTWMRVETNPPLRAVAVLVWMNGRSALGGWRDRVRQSWHNVIGGGTAPVVVSVTVDTGRPANRADADRVRQVQQRFLAAQSALPEQIARLASSVRSH